MALIMSREVEQEIIAAAAYRRAEDRGFAPGHELADWIAAEVEFASARSTFPAGRDLHRTVANDACDPAAQDAPRHGHTSRDDTHDNCSDPRVDHWEFYHYCTGKWTWVNRRPEGQRQSTDAFDSWIEAMADAIRAQFQAGESQLGDMKRSRRSEPRLPARR